jgi:hypothetical protein
MKIAFLSMTFNNNYGGMLQAYSLIRYLKSQNHEVKLLDVQLFNPNYFDFISSLIKRSILKYVFRRKDITWIFDPNYFKKRKEIIEYNNSYFIDNYIVPKTNKIFTSRDLQNQLSANYDAYIVGSDQVWRPSMYKFNEYAFFKGVGKDKIKLSYAPSFGVDTWEYSKNITFKIREQISEFRAVSVREDSGVELCKIQLGVNATHLLDPTFLLSKDEYLSLIDVESEHQLNHSVDITYYLLDENPEKLKLINEISMINNLKLFKNYKSKNDESINPYPSVFSWLDSFNKAKYVITDSYHGCVFSIIFNKPFLVFKNEFRGNARIESLLRIFNLEDCVIHFDKDCINMLQSKSYNWTYINQIIQNERNKSFEFLTKNLSE